MSKMNEPATGHQLHTITLLCMANKIKEPLEEKPMTKGEAGILIRRLINERRNRQPTVRTRSID